MTEAALSDMRKLLREQAEKFKAELAAGVDGEREEEIRVWLAFHKKQLAQAELDAIAIENHAPDDFLQPRFQN
jgi:hypothetical protein